MAKRAKQSEAKAAAKSEMPGAAMLEKYFGLKEQGTDIRTEFIAGLTTFLTMVYIVFVNPTILARPAWIRARYSSPPASLPR